jgi:hypothetical protein
MPCDPAVTNLKSTAMGDWSTSAEPRFAVAGEKLEENAEQQDQVKERLAA